MGMKIQVQAIVTYTCDLSDEDISLIKKHIDSNSTFLNPCQKYDEEEVLDAIRELNSECEIDLYKSSTESDFATIDIDWSEFEDRTADEILNGIGD